MKNANGSIKEPLALLAFRQNQSYRTVVRLQIDFDEISLRFSQSEIRLSILSTSGKPQLVCRFLTKIKRYASTPL